MKKTDPVFEQCSYIIGSQSQKSYPGIDLELREYESYVVNCLINKEPITFNKGKKLLFLRNPRIQRFYFLHNKEIVRRPGSLLRGKKEIKRELIPSFNRIPISERIFRSSCRKRYRVQNFGFCSFRSRNPLASIRNKILNIF